MKKSFLTLLFSAALCLTAAPMLTVSAGEMTGSFQVEVTEAPEVSPFVQGGDGPEIPSEKNADTIKILTKAITVDDRTYVFAEYTPEEGKYPGAYFFDENGQFSAIYKYSDGTVSESALPTYSDYSYIGNGEDNTRLYYGYMDKFTGEKEVTIGIGEREYVGDGNYEYNFEAVAKAKVTPEEWTGSLSDSTLRISDTQYSYYTYAYAPGKVSKAQCDLYLYEGDTRVGAYEVTNVYNNEYSSVRVDSMLGYEDAYISVGRFENTQISGNIRVGKKLTDGTTYTLKGKIDGKDVSFGSVKADGSPRVTSAYSSSAIYGTTPVVSVYHYGYKAADLTVKLLDKDGNVVATSKETKPEYSNETSYLLESSKSLKELDGTKIAVYDKDGKVLYDKNTFRSSYGVSGAYYDHVENVVVVRTYNIPDGTEIQAQDVSFPYDDDAEGMTPDYTATGTVQNNEVVLKFKDKDGKDASLPAGWQNIYYKAKFKVDDSDRTMREGTEIRVLGLTESKSSVNSLKDPYYFTNDASFPFEIRISENNSNLEGTSGAFYAELQDSEYMVVEGAENIAIKEDTEDEDGTKVYVLTGSLPTGLAADNYRLRLYRGGSAASSRGGDESSDSGTFISSYRVYMFKPDKVYGDMSGISRPAQLKIGVEVFAPEKLKNDKSKYTMKIQSVLGDAMDLGLEREEGSESSNYTMFWFDNAKVDEDLICVKAVAGYGDEGIIDMEYIKDELPLVYYTNPNYRKSDGVSAYTVTKEDKNYYCGFKAFSDATVYVYDTATNKVVTKWELKASSDEDAGPKYFTSAEFTAAGVEYNNGKVGYEVYAVYDGGISSWNQVFFGTKEIEIPKDATGEYEAPDGNSYIYKDGQVDTSVNGLIAKEGSDDKIIYVKDGQVMYDYTGLADGGESGWWYITDGYVDKSFNGFGEAAGAFWCVYNGQLVPTYTGIWGNDDQGFWYAENGMINVNAYGFMEAFGKWWVVVGGRVCTDYTGLYGSQAEGFWYIQDGAVNFGYNGFAEFGGFYWTVIGGRVTLDYTGIWGNDAQGFWYAKNGIIDTTYNGFVELAGIQWAVASGKVVLDYTGIWGNEAQGYWCVVNGMLYTGYTGPIDSFGATWNVVDGKVVF